MLDKQINIFTGNINKVKYIYKIINHYELIGYNYTAFLPTKPIDSYTPHIYLESLINGHIITYGSIDSLNQKLINKSNFFRTNLIILDIWNYYMPNMSLLNNIINIDMKTIVLTKTIPPSMIEHKFYNLKYEEFDFFELKGDYRNIEILNLHTNKSSKMDDLIKSNIRDIKINKLFD